MLEGINPGCNPWWNSILGSRMAADVAGALTDVDVIWEGGGYGTADECRFAYERMFGEIDLGFLIGIG